MIDKIILYECRLIIMRNCMILLTIFYEFAYVLLGVCIVLLEVYADIAERKNSQISNNIMAKVDMSTCKIY